MTPEPEVQQEEWSAPEVWEPAPDGAYLGHVIVDDDDFDIPSPEIGD